MEKTWIAVTGILHRLTIRNCVDLEVTRLPDDMFYAEAIRHSDGERIYVGHGNTLDECQQLAEQWMAKRAIKILEFIGIDVMGTINFIHEMAAEDIREGAAEKTCLYSIEAVTREALANLGTGDSHDLERTRD
jgi:hypothetical protein